MILLKFICDRWVVWCSKSINPHSNESTYDTKFYIHCQLSCNKIYIHKCKISLKCWDTNCPKEFWLFKDNLEEQIALDSQVWDDLENPLDEGEKRRVSMVVRKNSLNYEDLKNWELSQFQEKVIANFGDCHFAGGLIANYKIYHEGISSTQKGLSCDESCEFVMNVKINFGLKLH